jgi:hypothetical protein
MMMPAIVGHFSHVMLAQAPLEAGAPIAQSGFQLQLRPRSGCQMNKNGGRIKFWGRRGGLDEAHTVPSQLDAKQIRHW